MQAPRMSLFAAYGHGWRQLWKYFLHLFLVGLILAVATIPQGLLTEDHVAFQTSGMVLLQLLAAAYMILVRPVIDYGGQQTYLHYMRDEAVDIRKVFDGFRTNYLNIVLANLLVFAIVGIGILMLIIPGIIFACRLVFVPYLVMDKGLEPVAAVEKSWTMTRGHGWRIFAMFLLVIPLFLLGLLALVIGAFFVWIWVGCAFASLYYAVDSEEQKRLDGNGNGSGGSSTGSQPAGPDDRTPDPSDQPPSTTASGIS